MSDAEHPVAPPRPGTVHPHLARERALKVLFQADVRGEDPRVVLDRVAATAGALELLDELEPDEEQVAGDAELQQELTRRRRLPLDVYTRDLVGGVAAHRHAIDAVLEDVAERWTVTRMPVVDRNLLRLAVYELAGQDTPPAVVIDEAVALARGFAGERARPFVNGVLETIRQRVRSGAFELGAPVAIEEPHDDPATLTDDEALTDGEPAPGDAVPTAQDAGAWDAALDLLTSLDDPDDLGDVAPTDPATDPATDPSTDPSGDDPVADDVLDDEDTVSLEQLDLFGGHED